MNANYTADRNLIINLRRLIDPSIIKLANP